MKNAAPWVGVVFAIIVALAGALWSGRSYADDQDDKVAAEAASDLEAHEERAAANKVESDQRVRDDLQEIKAMIRAVAQVQQKQGEDIAGIKARQARQTR
jgi:hypothetical protein